MKYVPRLSAPSYSDKNWIKTTYGGYNYCIHIANGSCLPNCVGYAWGRWRELLGAYHKLSRGNAENWFGNVSDGYKRGTTPKVGAVICWQKGRAGNESDGAGHVAIVEKVNSDGSIVTSNSAYKGSRFYLRTLKPPFDMGGTYKFQGFIYLPIEFDEESDEPKPEKPTKTLKYTKGDKVVLNGYLYKDSYGNGRGVKMTNHNGTITSTNADGTKPYHIDKLGWVDESSLSKPETVVHTVKKGEYLIQIGKKYGVDWKTIAKANNIAGPKYIIKTGQKLVIPK